MTDSPARWSGTDHYRLAEDLLERAGRQRSDTAAAGLATAAQAHATLALVAVTAELASHDPPPARRSGEHDRDWTALLHPDQLERVDNLSPCNPSPPL